MKLRIHFSNPFFYKLNYLPNGLVSRPSCLRNKVHFNIYIYIYIYIYIFFKLVELKQFVKGRLVRLFFSYSCINPVVIPLAKYENMWIAFVFLRFFRV